MGASGWRLVQSRHFYQPGPRPANNGSHTLGPGPKFCYRYVGQTVQDRVRTSYGLVSTRCKDFGSGDIECGGGVISCPRFFARVRLDIFIPDKP
jgi:hypothetical protein